VDEGGVAVFGLNQRKAGRGLVYGQDRPGGPPYPQLCTCREIVVEYVANAHGALAFERFNCLPRFFGH